jgi:K+-sensing histidine kinase KdpD
MTTVDEVFLSRVGHDLRGELATMVAGVHYLLRYEAEISPTARRMLERVNGAGQRLKRLLDELDNAAWITGSDARSLLCEAVAPSVVVQAALLRLSPLAVAREVTIDARVPAELPEIDADPELLGTAFEYVIDFALARSPRRAIHLGAAIVNGVPVIEVRDEGGALEAGLLDRLLEPFIEKDVIPRAEPGQRRRERLGLGLAIAQGIFQAHGGSLRVSLASSGDGIVFHCTPTRPSTLSAVPPVSGRRPI